MMASCDLSDEYYAVAYNVEESLIQAGAVPGVDYNLLDIYKLSLPLVVEIMKANGFEYTYPAVEVMK